jgi:hypothetical protein
MIASIRSLLAAGSAAAALLLALGSQSATAAGPMPAYPTEIDAKTLYRGGSPWTVQRVMTQIARNNDRRAARTSKSALRRSLTREQREMMLHVGCVSRLRLDDRDDAYAYCDAAVELDGPRHWVHLVNRGNAHIEAGRQQAALADYEAASLWLAEHEVKGEPVERVRLAMQWAQTAVPRNQLAAGDAPR